MGMRVSYDVDSQVFFFVMLAHDQFALLLLDVDPYECEGVPHCNLGYVSAAGGIAPAHRRYVLLKAVS